MLSTVCAHLVLNFDGSQLDWSAVSPKHVNHSPFVFTPALISTYTVQDSLSPPAVHYKSAPGQSSGLTPTSQWVCSGCTITPASELL